MVTINQAANSMDKFSKPIFSLLIISVLLVSCSDAADEPPPEQTNTVSCGGTLLESTDAETLMESSGCLACHSLENRILGPSWNAVSSRYSGDPMACQKLIATVKNGGRDNWTELTGGMPMPALSTRVSDDSIQKLVSYILSLNSEGVGSESTFLPVDGPAKTVEMTADQQSAFYFVTRRNNVHRVDFAVSSGVVDVLIEYSNESGQASVLREQSSIDSSIAFSIPTVATVFSMYVTAVTDASFDISVTDISIDESLELAKASGCLACHSVEKKVVGPAWRDVGLRYKNDPNAKAQLIEKVKTGGKGNWTEVTGGAPMPPYSPRVSDEKIEQLVAYILSLAYLEVFSEEFDALDSLDNWTLTNGQSYALDDVLVYSGSRSLYVENPNPETSYSGIEVIDLIGIVAGTTYELALAIRLAGVSNLQGDQFFVDIRQDGVQLLPDELKGVNGELNGSNAVQMEWQLRGFIFSPQATAPISLKFNSGVAAMWIDSVSLHEFNHAAAKVGTCAFCHDLGNATKKPPLHLVTTNECGLCHDVTDWLLVTFNHNAAPGPCASCHTSTGIDGLEHIATTDLCEACHTTAAWRPYIWPLNHGQVLGGCANAGCHDGSSSGQAKPPSHIVTELGCETCHTTSGWLPTTNI